MTAQHDTAATKVIWCGPRTDCVDANVNRWYCMRGHDGAPDGVCPLTRCIKQGANRKGDAR